MRGGAEHAESLPMDPCVDSHRLLTDVGDLEDGFEHRVKELTTDAIRVLAESSDLAACLPALVAALGWTGVPRQLLEAMPVANESFDLVDLTNTLNRLGFVARRAELDWSSGAGVKPALWLRRGEPAIVIVGRAENGLLIFDPITERQTVVEPPAAVVDSLVFVDLRSGLGGVQSEIRRKTSWFSSILRTFTQPILSAFTLGLFINILALAIPLYVMTVYDRIIATGDSEGIWLLLAGAALAIACDLALRSIRTKIQIFVAARLNYIVGSQIVEHMLALSLALLERAGVSAQLARMRDLERVRGVLAGPLTTAMLELPVLAVFVLAIAFVAGWLAMVPVASALVLFIAALLYNWIINIRSADSARAGVRRQMLVVEALDKMRSVRVTGAEQVFRKRFAELSAASVAAGFSQAKTVAVAQSFGQLVLMASMLCLLAYGVSGVLDEQLTPGALIAVMMLGWRVQTPLQAAFVASTRLFQVLASVKQIDGLMALQPERPWDVEGTALQGVRGGITLDMVTFKPASDLTPVLMNVALEIKPGELIAVTGPNGIGNSSLLELIAGLHQPQGGAVRIDGRDVRQFDPAELRQVLAYAPHSPELFDTTIRENLRLAAPTATDSDFREALDLAGIRDLVMSLPDGLDSRVYAGGTSKLQSSLLGQLSLARAYVRGAPILLLDEPVGSFDFEGEFAFVDALNRLRGKTTIILVTYRPSHIRLADRVLVMKDGAARYFGEPGPVIEKITEAFSGEVQKEITQ